MRLRYAVATPGAGHAGRSHLLWAAADSASSGQGWYGGGSRGGSFGLGGARGGEDEKGPSWRERLAALKGTLTSERAGRALSLGALLLLTALLYMVGLSASGYGNEFYAAAAQAGSEDWWAYLWGSSDAGNSITVDKPPASLWVTALFVRVMGLSSWSILLPQAIMGVLSVWVLYATVRRDFGHVAGLLAGAALASTPVACLMFRFNNPDALLILLGLCATYCVMRAISSGADAVDARGWCTDTAASRARTGWMALAGVAMGFAFLTKQLQALLVLPGLGIAFLVASPTRLRRRVLDSAVAIGVMVVSAGWWVALTVLVPADMRPYIGGSETNSFVELTFMYNGLGRIFGNTIGTGTMASKGIQMSTGGEASLTRLLQGVWATQWSWLFPAALAGAGAVAVASGRAGRSERRRAQLIAWGSWLVVTFLVFSFMEGTIHQYYTVALVPAVAALVAMGARVLWERRERVWVRIVAAVSLAATVAWGCALVLSTSWLVAVLVGAACALAAASLALLAVGAWRRKRGGELPLVAQRACAVLAVCACLVVPVAHSVYTAAQGHHGSIVTAGPNVEGSDAMGGMGGGPGAGGRGGVGGQGGAGGDGQGGVGGQGGPGADGGAGGSGASAPGALDGSSADGSSSDGGTAPSIPEGSGAPDGMTPPDGTSGGGSSADGGSAPGGTSAQGDDTTTPGGLSDGGSQRGAGMGEAARGTGGGPSGSQGDSVSDELRELLLEDADSYTWVAAAVGSQSAAGYQLATEHAVMPIGGFNGTDPSPTLDEFKAYVSEGRIHYFIASGSGGVAGSPGAQSDESIASWVEENFESVTVDGVTLYDLTQPKA